MRSPASYFKTKQEGGYSIYRWFDYSRTLIFGFLFVFLTLFSYFEGILPNKTDWRILVTLSLPLFLITLFFFINDRYIWRFNKNEMIVTKGWSVLFNLKNRAKYYSRDQIQTLYSKTKTSHNDDMSFNSYTTRIYIYLKSGKTVRITNSLSEEQGDYLISELKGILPYGKKPKQPPVSSYLKMILVIAIVVFIGAVSPRLMEVGEHSVEDISYQMKIVIGISGSLFMLFILLSTDDVFKEGTLTLLGKVFIVLISLALTSGILYHLYVQPFFLI